MGTKRQIKRLYSSRNIVKDVALEMNVLEEMNELLQSVFAFVVMCAELAWVRRRLEVIS